MADAIAKYQLPNSVAVPVSKICKTVTSPGFDTESFGYGVDFVGGPRPEDVNVHVKEDEERERSHGGLSC